MNVLFICDEYPPGKNGGIGSMVQSLARELVRSGHRSFVAGLYDYSYGEKEHEVDKGVMVWRLRYGYRSLSHGLAGKIYQKLPAAIKRKLNGSRAHEAFVRFVEALIDREKIDVVEMPDWNSYAYTLQPETVWRKLNAPLVLKFHGSYSYFRNELGWTQKPDWEKLDEQLVRRADALAAVSDYTAQRNREVMKTRKAVAVLYNGIDVPPPIQRKESATPLVVFSGTLIPKKGIFQLMKAWNLVIQKRPDARLLVYGKGKKEQSESYLGPEARNTVSFEGHVSRDVLMESLSKATLAAFPSYSETFGIMCIEAMSRGCPVIYTRRSCGPEIAVHKQEALLVDPDDLPELSGAILELIENVSLRQKLSEQAYQSVNNRFNIKVIAQKHIEFYSTVIHNFGQR